MQHPNNRRKECIYTSVTPIFLFSIIGFLVVQTVDQRYITIGSRVNVIYNCTWLAFPVGGKMTMSSIANMLYKQYAGMVEKDKWGPVHVALPNILE